MSNRVRGRILSRTRPASEKRKHKRVLQRDYWAQQRMIAAVIAELEQDEFPMADWPVNESPIADVAAAVLGGDE